MPHIPLFTWLHLSDIHFGHGKIANRLDQALVLQEIEKDAKQMLEAQDVPKPDAILITGDIAFSGATRNLDEYKDAKAWFENLAQEMGNIPLNQIFMVPGNHDVQRNIAEADDDIKRWLDALREGKELLEEAFVKPKSQMRFAQRLKNYLDFAKNFAPFNGTAPQTSKNTLFWYQDIQSKQLPIRLIGLNTALLSQDDHDEGNLGLSMAQITPAFLKIPDNSLVIALSHHPLSWLRDAQVIQPPFRSKVHLHLHGHIHQANSSTHRTGGQAGDFNWIVAGAAHGDPNEQPLHGYNFASVQDDGSGKLILRVWHRKWDKENHDFRVDTKNTFKNKLYTDHALPVSAPKAKPMPHIQTQPAVIQPIPSPQLTVLTGASSNSPRNPYLDYQEFAHRLGPNWANLADYFGILPLERSGFTRGREPHDVLDWIKSRTKLHELSQACSAINRPDLLPLVPGILSHLS